MNEIRQSRTLSFLILWGLGLIGVFSLYATTSFLFKYESSQFLSKALIVAKIVAPVVVLTVSVLIGTFLAPKVGLSSSLIQVITTKRSIGASLSSQVLPGILTGFVLGCLAHAGYQLFQPFFPAEFVAWFKQIPLLPRFLHGGINEELIFRWGVMSFVLWILWRVLQKRIGKPRKVYCWIAIVLSASLFGLLHVPMTLRYATDIFSFLPWYFFFLNLFGGIVFGWLFWKKGLESSILAHIFAHLTVLSLALVFKGSYYI